MVNRWRGVFQALDALPEPITTKAQAIAWKGTLLTPERSPQVVNGIWLGAPRTVWKWAVENGLALDNPFVGIRVAAPKRRVQVRDRELREEEWKTILRATLLPVDPRVSAPVARLRRWAPWLLAHTGARGGEITQLRVEDVTDVAGVGWCLNLTPDAGTIKTGSARVVPIHAQVIEQGFLEVVKEVGSGPLFYRSRVPNEPLRRTAGTPHGPPP
jgi:integrase